VKNPLVCHPTQKQKMIKHVLILFGLLLIAGVMIDLNFPGLSFAFFLMSGIQTACCSIKYLNGNNFDNNQKEIE
jgi:hypothetical protein